MSRSGAVIDGEQVVYADVSPGLMPPEQARLERPHDARATVAELRAMSVEAAREDRLDVGRELVARTLLENGVPV